MAEEEREAAPRGEGRAGAMAEHGGNLGQCSRIAENGVEVAWPWWLWEMQGGGWKFSARLRERWGCCVGGGKEEKKN